MKVLKWSSARRGLPGLGSRRNLAECRFEARPLTVGTDRLTEQLTIDFPEGLVGTQQRLHPERKPTSGAGVDWASPAVS